MKSDFIGYYAPTEAEYQTLWKEGLVVLDTNVLLDLYRLPASARDELLSVLDVLSDRIWIPYQVALEFQRRRLTVIASERKATEDALSETNDLFSEFEKRISSLQMDKRGLGIESAPLIHDLKNANEKLTQAINEVHKSQLDIAISDPVRDRLDALLVDKIGNPPADQSELDEICKDGEERFNNKIPPGFEDASKDKNTNEATFYHDGICYQRKFGDLIFWRQLLNYAKSKGTRSVLLITSERKEDWWWREKGKTIGPRPELAREIFKISKTNLFWMYSSSQFLENARNFTKAKISDQSVTQLEEVARSSAHADRMPERRESMGYLAPGRPYQSIDFARIELAAFEWLKRKFGEVRALRDFPDFIVEKAQGLHGYEVKYTRQTFRLIMSPSIINSLLRGYVEVNEGRLVNFSLILVSDELELLEIMSSNRREEFYDRLDRLLSKYPIDEVIVGFVNESDNFVEVTRGHGSRARALGDWPNAT